jgi:hypothetical protein
MRHGQSWYACAQHSQSHTRTLARLLETCAPRAPGAKETFTSMRVQDLGVSDRNQMYGLAQMRTESAPTHTVTERRRASSHAVKYASTPSAAGASERQRLRLARGRCSGTVRGLRRRCRDRWYDRQRWLREISSIVIGIPW